jgi:hypothetical protein
MIQFILSIALLLSPARDHSHFSETVASILPTVPPLFADDTDRKKTAALLTVIAYRESSFRLTAKSRTNDFCWFQIHDRPDLQEDPAECVKVAIRMLQESMRMCPAHPIAFYAEGPKGCMSPRAQRISLDRMSLAKWAKGKVEASER